jgi:hypothetical protein
MLSRIFSLALLAVMTVPAFSQVVPSATRSRLQLSVGVGFSNFDLDYGNDNGVERRMDGGTVWFDLNLNSLNHVPSFLRGFGLDCEARDIDYDRPSTLSRMRQDVAEGGPIYTLRKYKNFHPYAKYLIGFGSIDFPADFPYPPFPPGLPNGYDHDTRTVLSPGFGLDYYAGRNIWVRADYEYEFWRQIFGPHDLNPNGITIGTSYLFHHKK